MAASMLHRLITLQQHDGLPNRAVPLCTLDLMSHESMLRAGQCDVQQLTSTSTSCLLVGKVCCRCISTGPCPHTASQNKDTDNSSFSGACIQAAVSPYAFDAHAWHDSS